MTNREKFKEVFGFDLDWDGDEPGHLGVAYCPECPEGVSSCDECEWYNWPDQEYKENGKD